MAILSILPQGRRTPSSIGAPRPTGARTLATAPHLGGLALVVTILLSPGMPTPPPLARPFPAPVTTQTVAAPGSIDATGVTDVSAALNAWVASVRDGSIVSFPAGATYRLTQGLQLANRHNLVFEGNGATFKVDPAALGSDQLASPFVLGHQYDGVWGGENSDIAIRNFRLVGNAATPGRYVAGQEGEAGLEIVGTARVEISGVTASAFPGDGVFFEGVNGGWLHDSQVASAGRNGVAVISGTAILVERSAFDVSGYCTFDVESNDSTQDAADITFLDNTAGTWGDVFLAADGAAGSVVDGLTVSGNRVTGSSLLTDVTLARRRNIVFTNNTSDVSADGPVLRFDHVDGLIVSGNIQPLRSGPLAAIVDSTAVTYGQASAPASSLPAQPSRVMIATGFAVLVLLVVFGAYLATRSRFRRREPPSTAPRPNHPGGKQR